MKKILLCAALASASCLTASADDYNYLTVASGSEEQSIQLTEVRKITFDDTNAIVWTTDGQVLFPLSELNSMKFTANPTAIEALPAESRDLQFANGKLVVKGEGILRIYNASGVLIRMAQVESDGTVDLNSLAPGVYIINKSDQTIKLRK